MRLMLCGSRSLVDHANIRRVLDVVHGKVPVTCILFRGERMPDRAAKRSRDRRRCCEVT